MEGRGKKKVLFFMENMTLTLSQDKLPRKQFPFAFFPSSCKDGSDKLHTHFSSKVRLHASTQASVQ